MTRVARLLLTGLVATTTLFLVPAAPASMGGRALRATVGVPLTVAMTGSGHVASEPAGIDCTDGAGVCSADFPDGTPVTLSATPPAGSTVSFPTSCGAGTSCLVDAGLSAATVDVLFAADPTLYLLVTGTGEVRATPLGQAQEADEDGVSMCNNLGWQSPTPDVCRLQFAPGRKVLLEVIPNGSDATFVGWSDPACTGQPTCTVVMPTVADVGGHFQPYDLTEAASFGPIPIGIIASVVGGGSVSSTPQGTGCTFSGQDTEDDPPEFCVAGDFPPGAVVTLHAENPLSVTWVPGTCDIDPARPSDCTLVATTSAWVSLSLGTTLPPFREYGGPEVLIRFLVGKTGSGDGSVSGGGVACGTSCSEDVVFGERATFTETPAEGSRFAGWHGGGCAESATSCTVTAGAASGITAAFEPAATTTTTTTTGTATTGTSTTTDTTPVVTETVTTTVKPQRLLARVSSASATRSGLRRTLVVRLDTSLPTIATVVTRGPHSLLLRRSFRLAPPRATLRILLPTRARPGRYRLTIRLADTRGQIVTVHPSVRLRR